MSLCRAIVADDPIALMQKHRMVAQDIYAGMVKGPFTLHRNFGTLQLRLNKYLCPLSPVL